MLAHCLPMSFVLDSNATDLPPSAQSLESERRIPPPCKNATVHNFEGIAEALKAPGFASKKAARRRPFLEQNQRTACPAMAPCADAPRSISSRLQALR